MIHSPHEVRRTERVVWMECSAECGNAWVVQLTPAGERTRVYPYSHECPHVQAMRRVEQLRARVVKIETNSIPV